MLFHNEEYLSIFADGLNPVSTAVPETERRMH